MAAAAYHLGRFSARAYSLLVSAAEQANLSVPEKCLALLMLRDLDAVDATIRQWRVSGRGDDRTLVDILSASLEGESGEAGDDDDNGIFEALDLALAGDAISTRRNLVVSLPTSAGKTRIAELCILACLAEGKKAVFVTPLRALSAQTEAGLQRTFAPLGKSVSTLYGSIGLSEID